MDVSTSFMHAESASEGVVVDPHSNVETSTCSSGDDVAKPLDEISSSKEIPVTPVSQPLPVTAVPASATSTTAVRQSVSYCSSSSDAVIQTSDFIPSARLLSTTITTSTVSSLLSSQTPFSTFGIALTQGQIGSPAISFSQKKKSRAKKDGLLFPIPGASQKRSFFPGRPRPKSRKTQLGFGVMNQKVATQTPSTELNSNEISVLPAPHPIQAMHDSPQMSDAMSPCPEELKTPAEILSDTPDSEINIPCSNNCFEKSATEDLFPEQWPGKLCSFCNLNERSVLGQGELTRFDPTPGFSVFKKAMASKSRRGSSESDAGQGNSSTNERSDGCGSPRPAYSVKRREKGLGKKEKCKSPKQNLDSAEDRALLLLQQIPVDELSLVGFVEEPPVPRLFENSGHTFAHHCCAAWSEGVCQTDDYVLVNVDKAVFAGMSQKCSNCTHHGATIQCRVSKCSKVFHYPCAATSDCFQDIKTMSLLCPDHLFQAPAIAGTEAQCVVCDSPGTISEQLFCTSCGHHYHGPCLDPPVDVNPVVRAGWQCPDCKICQTCRKPGDDHKMMMCDTCDKGYHIFCLKPAMSSVPKHGWKCKNCRICMDCGARTPGAGPSSRWHKNYSVCDGCYQQRNKGLACPICHRAYRYFSSKEMLQCNQCKKCIHIECNPAARNIDKSEYVCPICVNPPVNDASDMKDDKFSKDMFCLSQSQDSSLSVNEDSTSSMDFDFQVIEKNANPLSTNSGISLLEDENSLDKSEFDVKPLVRITEKPIHSSGKFPGKKKMPFSRPKTATKLMMKKRTKSLDPFAHRRGPKPKFKSGMYATSAATLSMVLAESAANKQDEEPGVDNKVILCAADDEFSLSQDVCVMCGSFGKDEEGRLIACAQCGQCYHPYCVNVKLTKIVMTKGWRCLDCTVCEGCGQPHDESRLILCDECDISYHIYCLDPPLANVPQGTWKCKWCVVCLECGKTTPGRNCQWQNNYTQCGPCSSQKVCPACTENYSESDLIIQCMNCERWVHGRCDQIMTDDQADKASDCGYTCILCRPKGHLPIHLLCPPSPPKQEIPPPSSPKIKEPELVRPKPPVEYYIDGVCLSESGMDQIRSLTIEQPKKQRMRRPKLVHSLSHGSIVPTTNSSFVGGCHQNETVCDDDSNSKVVTPDSLASDLDVKTEGDDDYLSTPLFPSLPEEGATIKIAEDGTVVPPPVIAEKKKRVRNLQKLGIGGFIAKPRSRSCGSKETVNDKMDVGQPPGYEPQTGSNQPCSTDNTVTTPDGEKPKKRRRQQRKIKNPVAENYPAYLREAFFGKDLLVMSKEQEPTLDEQSDDELAEISMSKNKITADKIVLMNGDQPTEAAVKSAINQTPVNEKTTSVSTAVSTAIPTSPAKIIDDEDLGDGEAFRDILPLPQDLPQDDELMNMLMNSSDDLSKNDDDALSAIASSVEQEGLVTDVSNSDEVNPTQLNEVEQTPTSDVHKDDFVADLLDPSFNLDAIDTGFPQMDSKDVEDVFKTVLNHEPDGSVVPQSNRPNPGTIVGPNSSAAAVQQTAAASTNAPPPQLSPHSGVPQQQQPPLHSQQLPPEHVRQHVQQPNLPVTRTVVVQQSTPPGQFMHMPTHAYQASPSASSSEFSSNPQFRSNLEHPPSIPWTPSASEQPEAESQSLSYNQRNVLKWESDEMLGPLSTISPVLYANINHPELKEEFPTWNDRAKQIAKIWRGLPSDMRQPFLQKARENRAANRMSKQQADAGKAIVKVPKEIEQERQWKQLQVLKQQKMQQQLQEQHSPGSFGMSSPTTPTGQFGDVSGTPSPTPQLDNVASSSFSPQQMSPSTPQSPMQRMSPAVANVVQVSRLRSPVDSFSQMPRGPMNQLNRPTMRQNSPVNPNPIVVHQQNEQRMFIRPQSLPRYSQRPESFPQSRMPASHIPYSQANRMSVDSYNQPQNVVRPSMAQDPYAKPPYTPRPQVTQDPYAQQPPTPRPQVIQDPYSQPPGTPRPTIVQDPYNKPPGTPRPTIVQDPYNKPPSTPNPQVLQEPHGHPSAALRPHSPYTQPSRSQGPVDPYSQPPGTPRPQMAQGPLMPSPGIRQQMGQIHDVVRPQSTADPYNHPPGTPIPKVSREPFNQLPNSPRQQVHQDTHNVPLRADVPRVSQDSFGQPPGTPRPDEIQDAQSDETRVRMQEIRYSQPARLQTPQEMFTKGANIQASQAIPRVRMIQDVYSQSPNTPRPPLSRESYIFTSSPSRPRLPQDQFIRPPQGPRPHVSQNSFVASVNCQRSQTPQDPYNQPPGTPRPQIHQDPYNQPPGTPRPQTPQDPYSLPPGTPRPQTPQDPYSLPPGTPRPQTPQDPYSLPPGTPRPQDSFSQPAGVARPQLLRDVNMQSPRPQLSSHNSYSQPPMTPRPVMSVSSNQWKSDRPVSNSSDIGQDQKYRQTPPLPGSLPAVSSSASSSFSPSSLRRWSPNTGDNQQTQSQQIPTSAIQQQQLPPLIPSTVEQMKIGQDVSKSVSDDVPQQFSGPLTESRSPMMPGSSHQIRPVCAENTLLSQQILRARLAQQQHQIQSASGQNQGANLDDNVNDSRKEQLQDLLQSQQQQKRQLEINQLQQQQQQQQRPQMSLRHYSPEPLRMPVTTVTQQQSMQHRLRMGMRITMPDGTFRQPLPPQVRVRMPSPVKPLWTGQQNRPISPDQQHLRMTVLHQQQVVRMQQQQNPSAVRNPLDPYDHLVTQRAQLPQQPGQAVRMPASSQDPEVGEQQSSRPLMNENQRLQMINQPSVASTVGGNPIMRSNESQVSSLHPPQLAVGASAEMQTLPNPEDELDDDELLGLGNDFNILEYADPELDKVLSGQGDKSNILDEQLDLDEKEDQEKKRVLKTETVTGNSSSSSIASKRANFQSKFLEFSQRADTAKTQIVKTETENVRQIKIVEYNAELKDNGEIRNTSDDKDIKPVVSVASVQRGKPAACKSFPNTMSGSIQTVQSVPPKLIPLNAANQSSVDQPPKVNALIQDQPLLLEDLLEQEKKEQRRQHNVGLIEDEPLLSDHDFEKLKADVLNSESAQINIAGAGSTASDIPPQLQQPTPSSAMPNSRLPFNVGLRLQNPQVLAHRQLQLQNRPIGAPMPDWQAQQSMPPRFPPGGHNINPMTFQPNHPRMPVRMQSPTHSVPMSPLMQHPALQRHPAQQNPSELRSPGPLTGSQPPYQVTVIPPPPVPPIEPQNETERQQKIQYEQWLYQQQHVISIQQKYFETEILKFRKVKKSLSTKQRHLRKNGGELTESDALELERIIREQAPVQKQLEQIRKQSRQHATLVQDYSSKQQKRQQLMAAAGGGGVVGIGNVTGIGSPQPIGMLQSSPHASAQSPMAAPGTPQSPLMTSSPIGSSVHSPIMQHSPSMHSPVSMSPSALMQHSPHGLTGPHISPVRIPGPQQQDHPRFNLAQDENNPFSESFQKREHIEKFRAHQRWLIEQQQQLGDGTTVMRHRMVSPGIRPDHSPVMPGVSVVRGQQIHRGSPGIKPSPPYMSGKAPGGDFADSETSSIGGGSRPGSTTPGIGKSMSPFPQNSSKLGQDSGRCHTPQSSAGGSRASTPRSSVGNLDIGPINSPRVFSDVGEPSASPRHTSLSSNYGDNVSNSSQFSPDQYGKKMPDSRQESSNFMNQSNVSSLGKVESSQVFDSQQQNVFEPGQMNKHVEFSQNSASSRVNQPISGNPHVPGNPSNFGGSYDRNVNLPNSDGRISHSLQNVGNLGSFRQYHSESQATTQNINMDNRQIPDHFHGGNPPTFEMSDGRHSGNLQNLLISGSRSGFQNVNVIPNSSTNVNQSYHHINQNPSQNSGSHHFPVASMNADRARDVHGSSNLIRRNPSNSDVQDPNIKGNSKNYGSPCDEENPQDQGNLRRQANQGESFNSGNMHHPDRLHTSDDFLDDRFDRPGNLRGPDNSNVSQNPGNANDLKSSCQPEALSKSRPIHNQRNPDDVINPRNCGDPRGGSASEIGAGNSQSEDRTIESADIGDESNRGCPHHRENPDHVGSNRAAASTQVEGNPQTSSVVRSNSCNASGSRDQGASGDPVNSENPPQVLENSHNSERVSENSRDSENPRSSENRTYPGNSDASGSSNDPRQSENRTYPGNSGRSDDPRQSENRNYPGNSTTINDSNDPKNYSDGSNSSDLTNRENLNIVNQQQTSVGQEITREPGQDVKDHPYRMPSVGNSENESSPQDHRNASDLNSRQLESNQSRPSPSNLGSACSQSTPVVSDAQHHDAVREDGRNLQRTVRGQISSNNNLSSSHDERNVPSGSRDTNSEENPSGSGDRANVTNPNVNNSQQQRGNSESDEPRVINNAGYVRNSDDPRESENRNYPGNSTSRENICSPGTSDSHDNCANPEIPSAIQESHDSSTGRANKTFNLEIQESLACATEDCNRKSDTIANANNRCNSEDPRASENRYYPGNSNNLDGTGNEDTDRVVGSNPGNPDHNSEVNLESVTDSGNVGQSEASGVVASAGYSQNPENPNPSEIYSRNPDDPKNSQRPNNYDLEDYSRNPGLSDAGVNTSSKSEDSGKANSSANPVKTDHSKSGTIGSASISDPPKNPNESQCPEIGNLTRNDVLSNNPNARNSDILNPPANQEIQNPSKHGCDSGREDKFHDDDRISLNSDAADSKILQSVKVQDDVNRANPRNDDYAKNVSICQDFQGSEYPKESGVKSFDAVSANRDSYQNRLQVSEVAAVSDAPTSRTVDQVSNRGQGHDAIIHQESIHTRESVNLQTTKTELLNPSRGNVGQTQSSNVNILHGSSISGSDFHETRNASDSKAMVTGARNIDTARGSIDYGSSGDLRQSPDWRIVKNEPNISENRIIKIETPITEQSHESLRPLQQNVSPNRIDAATVVTSNPCNRNLPERGSDSGHSSIQGRASVRVPISAQPHGTLFASNSVSGHSHVVAAVIDPLWDDGTSKHSGFENLRSENLSVSHQPISQSSSATAEIGKHVDASGENKFENMQSVSLVPRLQPEGDARRGTLEMGSKTTDNGIKISDLVRESSDNFRDDSNKPGENKAVDNSYGESVTTSGVHLPNPYTNRETPVACTGLNQHAAVTSFKQGIVSDVIVTRNSDLQNQQHSVVSSSPNMLIRSNVQQLARSLPPASSTTTRDAASGEGPDSNIPTTIGLTSSSDSPSVGDIQSETLPVSNTVQFTLRQTGMPQLGPAQASLFGSPLSSLPSPGTSPSSQSVQASAPVVTSKLSTASFAGSQCNVTAAGASTAAVPSKVTAVNIPNSGNPVTQAIINEMTKRGIPVTTETVMQVMRRAQMRSMAATSVSSVSTMATNNNPVVTQSQVIAPTASMSPATMVPSSSQISVTSTHSQIVTSAQIQDMINRGQPVPAAIVRELVNRGLPVTSTTISDLINAAQASASPHSLQFCRQSNVPTTSIGTTVADHSQKPVGNQHLQLISELKIERGSDVQMPIENIKKEVVQDKSELNIGVSDPQNVLLKHLLQSDEKSEAKDNIASSQPNLITGQVVKEGDPKVIQSLPVVPGGYPNTAGQGMGIDANKSKRKRNQSKSGIPRPKKDKDTVVQPKKRPRKVSISKPEQDYETYMNNLMSQLRMLPPLRILEPYIPPNFNDVPIFGSGNLNNQESKLVGTFGNAVAKDKSDYYSVYPFGDQQLTPPVSLPPTPPPHRGFYNQEFPQNRVDDVKYNMLVDGRRISEMPSSLPTPPPNRDSDSPDVIVSSSSPESFVFEPVAKYPGLQLIDEGDNQKQNKSSSPNIPLFAPIPVKAIRALSHELQDDKNKENIGLDNLLKSRLGSGGHVRPLKETGNVGVTLTLTATAAEDIRGVMNSLAELLKITPPTSYKIIERTTTPPSQRLGLYKKISDKDSVTSIQSILNGKPSFCRHCDIVVLNAGIKKKVSELPSLARDDTDDAEVIFCSTNCYMQFAITHRATPSQEKEAAAVVSHLSDIFGPIKPKKKNVDLTNDGKIENRNLPEGGAKIKEILDDRLKEETVCSGAEQKPKDVDEAMDVDIYSQAEQSVVPSSPGRKRSSSPDQKDMPFKKKWKDTRWKKWLQDGFEHTYNPNSDQDISEVLANIDVFVKPEVISFDLRKCELCHEVGDAPTEGPARLLNLEINKWIHLNCALWSTEVYETVNGALMNVETSCKRSRTVECAGCRKKGATVSCFKIRCTNIYHFGCAMKTKCMFFKDKTILCPLHIPKIPTPETELSSVAVFRRVYVDRDENKQIAKMVHHGIEQNVLRVGSLIFLCVGQLLPHQLQAFHSPNSIYPIGYKIIRMYWGMRVATKRCKYICGIHERDGKPEFRIIAQEPGYEDVTLFDTTTKGVWMQVVQKVEKLRQDVNSIKVFGDFVTGDDLFGLTEPAVLRVIESLPGVDMLRDYNFRYGRSPLLELPLAINPTGCARTEPKMRTHVKRPHTLHTRNSSRPAFQSTVTGFEVSCPYTKQFVHSKSSQYRKMKMEWRNNVYLARSKIQGLGLYAARDIEKHTMIIEYIGQLIRNEISDLHEGIYESQNRGVYMFRLDEDTVIDATLTGGLARYVNHSCNPNCVTECVQVDRENKILIIANRRITRGEELSYDYKFDMEDDQHKIPCMCGAANCRKWMN